MGSGGSGLGFAGRRTCTVVCFSKGALGVCKVLCVWGLGWFST